MPPRLDLNADLGESFGAWRLGDDSAMVGLVTSANVACGFHAGDALTLQRTCATAAASGVVVGAQVGYRQLAGFGRWAVDMPSAELTADVIYQIGALDGLCRVAGTSVAYVKPHGALYNTAAVDQRQARAVVKAVAAYDSSLPILGLPGSVLLAEAAAAGLRTVREAFADRATPPRVDSCRGISRGRCSPIPTRWPHACFAWPRKAASGRSMAATTQSRRTPSARTETPRAPWP